ncbi:MAG: lipid A deacylase LpxR family protein [Bacteroidetes bacterium]|nr:lipid A deacylase LpxR family protein [Bacteroidota bacterium]
MWTYLLVIVLLATINSCSQQTDNKTDESAYKKSIHKDKLTQSIIVQRLPSFFVESNTDTAFLYTTKVSKNVGDFVELSIQEIAAKKGNIERKPSEYHTANYTSQQDISSSTRLIRIVFDNDIFNNTDYYYTNGVVIELLVPTAKLSPLSKLLLGIKGAAIDLYGFSIKQNIYTPTNPDIAEISIGDRPFSAFLTIGQIRESYNLKNNFTIKSGLNFGVLGPASMGSVVQSSIHNIEPVGWNNQIKNNVVINYSVEIEKGIVSTPHFEFNITGGGNIGTIFNKLKGGIYLRTGNFTPIIRGLFSNSARTSNKSAFQYWFFVSGSTNIVFYDATLQGGLFSKTNSYIIQNKDINRLVLNLSVGFALYYKNVGLEMQNFYLSPEFKNAYDFRWGRIKLIFKI